MKITVPLSEQDLQDIQNGIVFDWEIDGIEVTIKLEEYEDEEVECSHCEQIFDAGEISENEKGEEYCPNCLKTGGLSN